MKSGAEDSTTFSINLTIRLKGNCCKLYVSKVGLWPGAEGRTASLPCSFVINKKFCATIYIIESLFVIQLCRKYSFCNKKVFFCE